MWYWHYYWLGASYVYDKTTTTKKYRFFWEFSKMPIFTKMIFYQMFDQNYTDCRSPPTRCKLQSFLWKFTKKCNSACSVDSAHRQILSHARSTKNAWQSSKYVRKKSLQIIITCSKSKKTQHLFFLQCPRYYKETKRPAPQAPAGEAQEQRRRRRNFFLGLLGTKTLRKTTAPQAEKKKFRPFGGQNLKENNRQKEAGNKQTNQENARNIPKNKKCQFFSNPKNPKYFVVAVLS